MSLGQQDFDSAAQNISTIMSTLGGAIRNLETKIADAKADGVKEVDITTDGGVDVSGGPITNKGTLTVKGNGKVDNVTHRKGALVNNGKVTVLSGTFTRSKEAGIRGSDGGNSWYVIDNNGTKAELIFKGGSVVYSNFAKMLYAKVQEKTLNQYGAISANTVTEMALNTAKLTKTDICIAISGNAGPICDENKPMGFAYLGICVIDKVHVFEFQSSQKERNNIRIDFANLAFDKLLSLLKDIRR